MATLTILTVRTVLVTGATQARRLAHAGCWQGRRETSVVGDEPCVQSPFTPGRAVGGTAGPLVACGVPESVGILLTLSSLPGKCSFCPRLLPWEQMPLVASMGVCSLFPLPLHSSFLLPHCPHAPTLLKGHCLPHAPNPKFPLIPVDLVSCPLKPRPPVF